MHVVAMLTFLTALVLGSPAWAARLELVASGLTLPLYVAQPRDGTGRLFVVEQTGRIKVFGPERGSPTIFLDLSRRVLVGGERGLLGMAFHPSFPENGRYFVTYSQAGDGATVIAEFRVDPGNPDVTDPATEIQLLVLAQPFTTHKGGMVEFGPDGFLYISVGDGGPGNDPGNRAQDVDDPLGKILRIDVNRTSGDQPYSSPGSNPFVGRAGRDEIFALGFRNPFRFSFDRATGLLWAGDVGEATIEEINVVTAGGNYGWRILEGSRCTDLGPARCDDPRFILPVAEYQHTPRGRCSVTGGYVYRGAAGALPDGAYVYGDFCTGEIFLLEAGQQRVLFDTSLQITSFGEDAAGELYVVGRGGTVHRLVE
jgi:glucose/arabinose dehydrogenase